MFHLQFRGLLRGSGKDGSGYDFYGLQKLITNGSGIIAIGTDQLMIPK